MENEIYIPTKWETFTDKYWYDTKFFDWYLNLLCGFYKHGGKSVCFLFGHQYRNSVDHEPDYNNGTKTYISKVYCMRCNKIFGSFGCRGHTADHSLTGSDAPNMIHYRRCLDKYEICKNCYHAKYYHNLTVYKEYAPNHQWPNGEKLSSTACSLIVDPSNEHEMSRGHEPLCPCRNYIC